jgi:intraflagellar transport protein 172
MLNKWTNVCFLRASIKAVEAAINSRQWAKAVQILETQDSAVAAKYYKNIGDHYSSIGEYEVGHTCRELRRKT